MALQKMSPKKGRNKSSINDVNLQIFGFPFKTQPISLGSGDFLPERNGRIPKEFGVFHSRYWWSVGTLAKTQRSLADLCCFAPGKETANQKKTHQRKVVFFLSQTGSLEDEFFFLSQTGCFFVYVHCLLEKE